MTKYNCKYCKYALFTDNKNGEAICTKDKVIVNTIDDKNLLFSFNKEEPLCREYELVLHTSLLKYIPAEQYYTREVDSGVGGI